MAAAEVPVSNISCTQGIALYTTKSRFYVVGSNNTETKFRILKIDRTEPHELNIVDDQVEYSEREIKELLFRIDQGNRPKQSKAYDKDGTGLQRTVSAFGIVGFVRFLEGYYIILITRRRRVAQIGGHTIYKIDETSMTPIPNETVRQKYQHPDEAKYVKSFQNVDLSSNFYFSYSYDLTHTLQFNMAPYVELPPRTNGPDRLWAWNGKTKTDQTDGKQTTSNGASTNESAEDTEDTEDANSNAAEMDYIDYASDTNSSKTTVDYSKQNTGQDKKPRQPNALYRDRPCAKFVWNNHMLKDWEGQVHSDWILHIVYGFVGQHNICVFGQPIYITLIARRSSQFAGTRFLKRGTNDEGFVANEVETEQIVHNASVLSFESGKYTSYVQLRGSVPLYWSQDIGHGVVPKPQINLDRADPYFKVTGLHFNHLLERYGAPIIILNLMKKKEKKRHEQILSEELQSAVEYLNQFLPSEYKIQYIAWDMAKFTKSKEQNVLETLAEIANGVMKSTGFFQSGPQLYCNQLRPDERCNGMGGYGYNCNGYGCAQAGVVRVNCVDCLDRTNTAQFMVAKCALGFQLYALGVIDKPVVDCHSEKVLEELFEAHGDTLALQYGGSQLVHRIQSYRKISPWTSHSRDIMQTVSRYYSNAFTDADKQQGINLFLGMFEPEDGKQNLWDYPTDYYMHHTSTTSTDVVNTGSQDRYTKWYNESMLESLPLPHEEVLWRSKLAAASKLEMNEDKEEEEEEDEDLQDMFSEFHCTHQLTIFEELYSHHMPISSRNAAPEKREFNVKQTIPWYPIVSSVPVRHGLVGSPQPPGAAEESSDEDSSSDDERDNAKQPPQKKDSSQSVTKSFEVLFPTSDSHYGVQLSEPSKDGMEIYNRYVDFGEMARPTQNKVAAHLTHNWADNNPFPENSTERVSPPVPASKSIGVYKNYVQTGSCGYFHCSSQSLDLYRSYIAKCFQ